MEIQMSPASSFIAANRERLHASTPKSYEPTAKRFKSDLTFHCIVCSDVYDDPNVLYEHMKKCHPELYERGSGTENEEDVYSANDDDEINHIDLSESNGFDSDHELSEEELVDLSRLLEPICELRHEGDEDDEVQKRNVQNGNATGNNGMLSSGSIEQAIQMNPLLNQLTNEQQLRLQLQLQMQLQQHLLQLQQVQNLKQAHNQLDVSLKASNGNASRPLALPQGPGRGRRREAPVPKEEMPPAESCLFQCTQCDSSFIFAGDLAKHVRSHTQNKPYQCSICLKTFTHIGSLNTHIRIHSGEKPYKCKLCTKAFTQSSSLMVHMRSHSTRKPHQCQICDKGFVNSSSLVLHMKTHTEGDPYPCPDCDKRFKSEILRSEHQLTHTEANLYQCSICRLAYKQSCELVQHMKNHTGDKPFACSICEKAFTQPGSLNTHMRIHTGEKPFACKECDKSFTQASSLSVHMKVHMGEKQYRCTFCQKSYSQQSYLNKHMLFHTANSSAYTCKWCNKQFGDSSQLITHVTKEHDITNGDSNSSVACIICRQVFTTANGLLHHLREHVENGQQSHTE